MTDFTLESLYNKYSDMIYRVCMRYTKNPEDASDMMQDIFIKANERISTFESNAQISTWLYRIAVNRCIDKLRELKRRNRLESENIHTLVERNITVISENTLTKLTLGKVLETADSRTKEALFLHYAEGLRHHEIAEVQGVSRGAITKRINKFIKKMIAAEGDDPNMILSLFIFTLLAVLFCL